MINNKKVAAVMFINPKKEIMLQLRDSNPLIQRPNTWGFIGGHVNVDETILNGLKREVMEEIDIKIINPVYIGKFDDGIGNDVFVYKSEIDVKAEDLKLTEGQEVRFFDIINIMKLKNIPKCMIDFFSENKNIIFN